MLIVPAMNTSGEKVGTWSFPQPCDYLHFDKAIQPREVMDEVLKVETCIWAGALQEALEVSRRECLQVAMQAFENKLETIKPEWWTTMDEPARPSAIAHLLVQLSPAWELMRPEVADSVLLVPNEEVGSVLHVRAFGDKKLREYLSFWSPYWKRRRA